MIRYHDMLRKKLDELRQDEATFFQTAYYACFKKSGEVFNDVVQYRLHAIIPIYVINFLDSL